MVDDFIWQMTDTQIHFLVYMEMMLCKCESAHLYLHTHIRITKLYTHKCTHYDNYTFLPLGNNLMFASSPVILYPDMWDHSGLLTIRGLAGIRYGTFTSCTWTIYNNNLIQGDTNAVNEEEKLLVGLLCIYRTTKSKPLSIIIITYLEYTMRAKHG